MLKRFIRPALDLVHRAVIQFLKFWRDAPWPKQVVMIPLALLAMLYLGFYTLFFGCRR